MLLQYGSLETMFTLRKILVPVDFSPCSKHAFEVALRFAERFDASVHVLYAWEIPVYLRPDLTVWAGEVSATLADHTRAEAAQGLEGFLAGVEVPAPGRLTSAVVSGAAHAAILAAAEQGGFDLIAMGTHGRSGFSHLLLGSVAEKVVRHAKSPVLTVRSRT